MECPIKVNRHKGGRVDVYLCGSVGSSVPSGLGSNPVTSLNFSLSSFLLLVKLQLACDDQCLFFILHRQLQRNYYFLQIHSLNLRKEENLSFDNILFVNDWRVINKYHCLTSPSALKVGGGGENVYLEHSFKSELIIFFPNDFLR